MQAGSLRKKFSRTVRFSELFPLFPFAGSPSIICPNTLPPAVDGLRERHAEVRHLGTWQAAVDIPATNPTVFTYHIWRAHDHMAPPGKCVGTGRCRPWAPARGTIWTLSKPHRPLPFTTHVRSRRYIPPSSWIGRPVRSSSRPSGLSYADMSYTSSTDPRLKNEASARRLPLRRGVCPTLHTWQIGIRPVDYIT